MFGFVMFREAALRRWDRLLDAYMEEYRARGVSPQTIGHTEARLSRWGRWLKRRRPRLLSSIFLSVVVVGLIAAAIYFFFLKVVWLLLPRSIRVRIPYDRKEASESKGDIKSFWDLRKLVRPKSGGS